MSSRFYIFLIISFLSFSVFGNAKGLFTDMPNEMLEQSSCDFDFSIISNSPTQFCYDQKSSIQLSVDIINNGTDTISGFTIDWYYVIDAHGTSVPSSDILPGSSLGYTLPTLSFPSEGFYTISLWVNTFCNGVIANTDTLKLNIIIRPPFIVDYLADTMVCLNSPVILSLPSGIGSYNWSSGQTNASIVALNSGMYMVTVTDNFGCSATDSASISYFDIPETILGSDTVLCEGTTWIASATVGFNEYRWNSEEDTISILVSEPRWYSVVVEDSNGCVYNDSIQIMEAGIPNPGIPSNVKMCEGDTVVVSAQSNFSSYSWSTGATTNSIPLYATGIYTLSVVDDKGCIGVDTVNVMVQPLPTVSFNNSEMCNNEAFVLTMKDWFPEVEWSTGETTQEIFITQPGWYGITVTDELGCTSTDSIEVVNLNISVTLGPDKTICTGTPFALFPQGSFDTYHWSDGSTGPTLVVTNSGIYSLSVSKGTCVAYDEVNLVVEEYPVAEIGYLVNSPEVQFTNLSSQNNNLIWTFGDGDSSLSENPIHQYQNQGVFEVTLTVSNTCGSVSKIIEIGIFPQSSNGNISHSEGLSIFPTPATNQIQFKLSSQGLSDIQYIIFDITGRKIFENSEHYLGSEFIYQVDVANYAAGTYFLQITDNQSLIVVQPFVIQ